jgi:thymidylate synthase ThyX
MSTSAKIIADSIKENGGRITTFQLKFHRFILPEFNTHRVFSKNASSSRAIPTSKIIEQVITDPAMPIHWGVNRVGMQADTELDNMNINLAKEIWKESLFNAVEYAKKLMSLGLHKQTLNRILEPYQWTHMVMTTTEMDNFFNLRLHKDAQPEIQLLANKMLEAYSNSTPNELHIGEWHLPYIHSHEKQDSYFSMPENLEMLQKISAARCCRVSYNKHDGGVPSISDDLTLVEKLIGDKSQGDPPHLSPFEHAVVVAEDDKFYFNHRGFKSYRWIMENK